MARQEDSASEHADTLSETFGLDPETARVAANDQSTNGMRKPASDDVEQQRIEAAGEEQRDETPHEARADSLPASDAPAG